MASEAAALFVEGPDRLLSPAELAAMPGLEFVRGMRDGRFPHPPICRALHFRLVEAEDGRVAFEGRPGFDSYNPLGAIHGGWFGALLDSAMSCAVQTRLPRGRGYTTLEYKVSMIRPVTVKTGPVRATGRAAHVGRRTGVAEGRMEDSAGRLYATGSATCLVFELG